MTVYLNSLVSISCTILGISLFVAASMQKMIDSTLVVLRKGRPKWYPIHIPYVDLALTVIKFGHFDPFVVPSFAMDKEKAGGGSQSLSLV